MKIVHCLNQYMPDAMAGTEIYVHTLAGFQNRSGHQVAVLVPHIEYYNPGKIKNNYQYEGIEVYQFLENGDPTDRQIHYGKKKPSGLNNFKNFLIKFKPDVVHFHELNRSIGLTIEHVKLAKQMGAKVFLTAHLSSYTCNTNILIRQNKLCNGVINLFQCTACSYQVLFNIPEVLIKPLTGLSLFLKKSYLLDILPAGSGKTLLHVTKTIERIKSDLATLVENVDQIISYSKWYKEILIQNNVPIQKISVVPVALVSMGHLNIKPVLKTMKLPVRFVFIGRIQETKGIHLMIEAFRHFDKQSAQIDIYGAAEETSYYKDCISKSADVGSVNFMGPLKREAVLSTLSQYDMFCLASTFSEMSPLVIQESFAAGIPVLASKVYGNIEQIKHGYNGLLFDFNSPDDLKMKIEYLVNDTSIIRKLSENIIPPNQFQMVHEAYLEIYNRTYI